MPDIFEYTNFRKYLEDYYIERKKDKPHFTYQVFADMAGFRNRGFIYNIIKSNKKLSKSNILKLSTALQLSKREAEYFENLIGLNQSCEHELKKLFYERLASIRNQGGKSGRAGIVREDQYEYYSRWYYSTIRSVINNYDFTDDYKWLSRKVYPNITAWQARKAVELLERLGMIKKQSDGKFIVTDAVITTGKEVRSLAMTDFHDETLQLAQHALKVLPKNRRHVTGLTLGISKKTYDTICERTWEFQSELLELAKKDQNADRVYQYEFALFPVSNT